MDKRGWLLYGANGYTGELIAEEAARRGEKPVLAGRRAEAIEPIARRLGLEHEVFGVDEIAGRLGRFQAVLLCAGPFSATSAPVVEACLRTGTHYLDITGEIAVFEACAARDAEARAASVTLLPGVGFDVVPSDCLAANLKAALPDATSLELAFAGGESSKGTAKTAVEGIALGGRVRENGRLRKVPLGWKRAEIPFRDRTRTALSIPWGDVSTAWSSTKIPNIIVYLAQSPREVRLVRVARLLAPVLKLGPVQRMVKRRIERTMTGPSEEKRRTGQVQLWGRVRNAAGRTIEGTLVTPEGYRHTVEASLECMARVLAGSAPVGYQTPSMAFGAELVTRLPGCSLQIGSQTG